MFSQERLQELLAFAPGDDKVISLYLNVDTTHETSEAIKLRLRSLLKEANLEQTPEAKIIERYFDHAHDWAKPGLALFCADHHFFRVYPAPVAFRNRVRVGQKPYLKPLLHLADHYAHYGVVVVDRVGAKFFEYHLGELQDGDGYIGEEIRKVKRGGGSAATGMRDKRSQSEAEQVVRNMREAGAAAGHFFAGKGIRRLFLGGTAENVAQFREMLPRQLQSCVVGSFPMDIDVGEREIRLRTLTLLTAINAKREAEMVEQLVTISAKGGPAVTGLDETLRMVSDGRVQTLVISDGFRAAGFRHEPSGYLTAREDRELFGEGQFEVVTDVVEAAVAQTLGQGGHVEVISENPQLEGSGRVGALLRY